MANERLYAARDVNTGKLVSDITNPKRKYVSFGKGNVCFGEENRHLCAT